MTTKSTPESKFRKHICESLKTFNAKIINNPQAVGKTISGSRIFPEPGVSDTIVIHKYIGIVFFEFKAANGKLSEIQRRFITEVNERAPFSAFVVREFEYEKDIYGFCHLEIPGKTEIATWEIESIPHLFTTIQDLKRLHQEA